MPALRTPDLETGAPASPACVISMPPLTPADEPEGMLLPGETRRELVLRHLGTRVRVVAEGLAAMKAGALGVAADSVAWLEGPMSGPAPGMTPKHRSS
jgi:hypothetical protein